jgi:hypothetical protein
MVVSLERGCVGMGTVYVLNDPADIAKVAVRSPTERYLHWTQTRHGAGRRSLELSVSR